MSSSQYTMHEGVTAVFSDSSEAEGEAMESNKTPCVTKTGNSSITQDFLEMADLILEGYNGGSSNAPSHCSTKTCKQCQKLTQENQQLKALLEEMKKKGVDREHELQKFVMYSVLLNDKLDVAQATLHRKNGIIADLQRTLSKLQDELKNGNQIQAYQQEDRPVEPWRVSGNGNWGPQANTTMPPTAYQYYPSGYQSTTFSSNLQGPQRIPVPLENMPAAEIYEIRESSGENLKCSGCTRMFVTDGHLNYHKMLVHDMVYMGETKEYMCGHCGAIFANRSLFYSHYRQSHFSRTEEESTE